MNCSIAGCDRPARSRGWCPMHYSRWQRNGDPEVGRGLRGSPEKRFWAKVQKTDGCWEWTAGLANGGYGAFWLAGRRYVKAHRFAYEHLVGPIPEGMQIDHLCRNPPCVNPAHLEVVTQQVNVARGQSGWWQARKTHCPQGHEYTPENTIVRNKGRGRNCRACHNEVIRRRRQRLKAAEG